MQSQIICINLSYLVKWALKAYLSVLFLRGQSSLQSSSFTTDTRGSDTLLSQKSIAICNYSDWFVVSAHLSHV